MWAALQGPVKRNIFLYPLFQQCQNTKSKQLIDLTSMKANIGSPSFHSWQSGDKVDKHPALCILLSYLVDFIDGRIPKSEQQNSIWQKHTVKYWKEWKCWTYLADAMRLALWDASSKSHSMIRILMQGPMFPSSVVRKFLRQNRDLILMLRSYLV